eukprot:RCo018280
MDRTAAHVVPVQQVAVEAFLAGAEFFQVVRGGHAGSIEEVFVLADAVRTGFGRFTLRGQAVDGHFGLVDRNRTEHTDLRAELIHDEHVRVQAEVPQMVDHPAGARFAKLFHQFSLAFGNRPVLAVRPLDPQADVTLFKSKEAARHLVPATGVHRLHVVGRLAGLAAVGGGDVVPVGGGDVIAVGAVFRLNLPVAVKGVGGRTTQHFEAFRRLVAQQVEDAGGFAQVFLQRLYIVRQAGEQETTVVFKTRQLLQVVRTVAVEGVRVAGAVRILHLDQLAGGVEGPAVERAGEHRLVAAPGA